MTIRTPLHSSHDNYIDITVSKVSENKLQCNIPPVDVIQINTTERLNITMSEMTIHIFWLSRLSVLELITEA